MTTFNTNRFPKIATSDKQKYCEGLKDWKEVFNFSSARGHYRNKTHNNLEKGPFLLLFQLTSTTTSNLWDFDSRYQNHRWYEALDTPISHMPIIITDVVKRSIALLEQPAWRASQATKMQLQEKNKLKCLQVGTGGIRKKWCSRGKGWIPSTNRPLTHLNSAWEEQNTAEIKMSLDLCFQKWKLLLTQVALGQWRKLCGMSKASNSPNKAGSDGNIHNSFLQTDSNVLREHSIFYLQLSLLPRTPTLYYGMTGAVSPKTGNFQRHHGGKNSQNKN